MILFSFRELYDCRTLQTNVTYALFPKPNFHATANEFFLIIIHKPPVNYSQHDFHVYCCSQN